MLLSSPCKDCPDRYLACHDHCEKFKQYKQEYRDIQNNINNYNLINSYQYSACKRSKKYRQESKKWRRGNASK